MKICGCSSWPSRIVAAVLLCAAPSIAMADGVAPACDKGGDELGFSVATNGDFNGDGVMDIAVGAPCTYSHKHVHAGRVIVVDGRTFPKGPRVIFRKRGKQDDQWFGYSVSFLPDLNGDGRSELAVGSPGYRVTAFDQGDPQANAKDRAGRVDVYQKGHHRLKAFGSNIRAGFGEKIAPLNDINGDGWADFVVSASGDRNANGLAQPGRVYTVSGKNGDLLGYRIGPSNGNNYGRSLATGADFDGDGFIDFLVGSDLEDKPGVQNAGIVDAISPADLSGVPMFEVVGAHRDRIGKSIDFAGDVNDDEIPDLIVGSDGSDDTGVRLAGLVTLFSLDGTRLWTRADTEVQEGARFGDAVARIGDIDGDGVTDFAVSAAKQDIFVNKRLAADAGRVVTLSGATGAQIWDRDGDRRKEEFGAALDGDIDFNLDEVPDVVVGTPGDDPQGRRGAGSVKILSGIDGTDLLTVSGRHGLETRIITVTPDQKGDAHARSFARGGHATGMNTTVLDGVQGDFSAAVVGEFPFNDQGDPHFPRPKSIELAVSGGYGSHDSTVQVYRVAHQTDMVDSFEAFPDGNFGAECASTSLAHNSSTNLLCAQADGADGNVFVNVFTRLDDESPFFLTSTFQVFADTDTLNGVTPIAAEGANIEVGDVNNDGTDEIVVGTTRGVPMVKIFKLDGTLIRSFLAYDPVGYSGVDIALADLDGSGDKWIVTAPRQGEALIKVFNGDGQRVGWGPDNTQININVDPAPYDGGARVAAADVDLDDQQEILIYVPGPEGQQLVYAYEPTNKPVKGFVPFDPLADGQVGGAIAATDRWVRN